MRSFSQSGLQLAGIVVTFQGEDCSRLSVRTGGGKQCWRMQKVCQNVPSVCDNIGAGRHCKPVLHPIPVQKPFQVLEVDVMDLPATEKCNGYVVVIQDLFTKWPMVFPVPDQKASRIAKLVAEEVVPLFGVPESLLSDRGTNLLSRLVLDLCGYLEAKHYRASPPVWWCRGEVQ